MAGHDRLAVIVGPAGTGKATMLRAAVTDLHSGHRPVIGLAPTARAAHVLHEETGVFADTVAKLVHEWSKPGGPDASWQFGPGLIVIIDEAGMLSTPDLHRLTRLADSQDWRLTLVGDHRQLHAVRRGGLFAEVCATVRTIELETVHRFSQPWAGRRIIAASCRRHVGVGGLRIRGRIIPARSPIISIVLQPTGSTGSLPVPPSR